MRIETASPHDPDVALLLDEHLAQMRAGSPPGSVHALPHDALAAEGVVLVAARRSGPDPSGHGLLGIGALKRHDAELGELKAMRTAEHARGAGVGAAVLDHLIGIARAQGASRVSLETGTQPLFEPARRLYARRGFVPCGPFASYVLDPHSVFMTLSLD